MRCGRRSSANTSRSARGSTRSGRPRHPAFACWQYSEEARRSRKNPRPGLYDDVLEDILDLLNAIPPDEASFRRWSQVNQLAELVRQLPGPPPRELPDKYVAVLNELAAARTDELAALRADVESLTAAVTEQKTALDALSTRVDAERDRVTEASKSIRQTVDAAEERLNGDWTNRVNEWSNARDRRDAELDERLNDQVILLARAAQVGRRLVEHAAGMHTALGWTSRATRERKTGLRMRVAAIAVFGLAVLLGGVIVWNAIATGFDLTLGDGILRAGLILTAAGAGAYLATESRRHYREADTAEEVAAALTAIEPFYADAQPPEREKARQAVGETVFVRNVLSRFTHRDASKHATAGSLTTEQLNEVIEALSKTVDLGKRVDE